MSTQNSAFLHVKYAVGSLFSPSHYHFLVFSLTSCGLEKSHHKCFYICLYIYSHVYYRPGTVLCTSYRDEQDKILDVQKSAV